VERKTQDLPTCVLLIIAPTRVLFDSEFIKGRVAINAWSWFFLVVNLIFLVAFSMLGGHHLGWRGKYLLLWVLPFSRIVEITYAFYNDAFDQMAGQTPRSGLSRVQRFKLLGRSYFEVAVCYASLYLACPSTAFTNPPTNGFESLYFSWITITTTGFGDVTPKAWLARAFCMTEVAVGLMLLVLAVGTYFSLQRRIAVQAEKA